MNYQKPYNRFNGGYNNNHGHLAKKHPQKLRITVDQGKVAFRLLCPTVLVGGVIGPSGATVKSIEQESSSKIMIEDVLTVDCTERLVYVVGPEDIGRAIRFRNIGDGEIEDIFEVSLAQEALIRVYERIIEIDRDPPLDSDGKGFFRCCRLLAVSCQIGALMGRDGKNIAMIRKDSGAYIRVLMPDQVQSCADQADEIIQITGDSIAVRKALVLVSKCIQENQPIEKASTFVTAPSFPSYPNNGSSYTPFAGNVMKPRPKYMSFRDKDSYHNTNGSTIVEVVFKMLCCSDIIGCLIGKGGNTIRALQDETGASVNFGSLVAGCQERVITVSAMEKVGSHQSPGQNAVLRVFARIIDALTNTGLLSKWSNGEGVIARLIISPNQVGCLIGVGGTIISDMQRSTGAAIQIYDEYEVPQCASTDDRVVQISGGYANVKNALADITRRLRERLFFSKGLLHVEQAKISAPYRVPDFVPPRRTEVSYTSNFNQKSYGNEPQSLERKMENLNIHQGVNVLLPHQQFATQRGVSSSTENSDLVNEDNTATVTNVTVEVPVSENIFSSVFGEDGSSLARLREISGAEVELQNPSDGNDGKVIISGTPDQTLAGQSLLRAYIVTAK